MVQLLRRNCQFHEFKDEDANEHLDKYLSVTQFIKQNGISQDIINLNLFLFSLTHEAESWFYTLKTHSIHTWEEMVSKFLSKYYPYSRALQLRRDILNFRQLTSELVFQAWERFKSCLRKCSDHRILLLDQIQTFYYGITMIDRDKIMVAAGGNITRKTPQEAYDLIENMTQHHFQSESDEDEHSEVLQVQKSINPLSGSPTPFPDPVVESLSPSFNPCGDSDLLLEETDAFLSLDDSIPPGIDNDIYDSEGDILFLEGLLNDEILSDLPPLELNNDPEGDILFLENLLKDEPLEANKSGINPLIREPTDTFLMGDTKTKFNPHEDIDDLVPIPRVSEKPLDSLDCISKTFEMTITDPLFDFDFKFTLNSDNPIFGIHNEESDEIRMKELSQQQFTRVRYGFLNRLFSWFAVVVVSAGYRTVCLLALIVVRLSGCHDGSGNGLTKTFMITHLRDRHCKGDAQVITKQTLATNLAVFDEAEVTFKRMGLWLCGVCFKTHTLRSKCRHSNFDFIPPPDCGDGIVRFVLYDFTKPSAPSSSDPLDHVDGLGQDMYGGFTLTLLDRLLSKGLRNVKSIPPKSRLGFSRVLKGALDKCKSATKRQRQEECIASGIRSWGMPGGCLQLLRETLAEPALSLSDTLEEDLESNERNIKKCKRKICDGHYTAAIRVLSSSGIAPYTDATLDDLKAKHPFKPAPSLPHIPTDHHQLLAPSGLVLDMIKSFPRGTSCGRDGLRAQHLMDCLSGAAVAISDELIASITQVVNLFLDGKCPKMLGEYIASAPLTPLVKPGGGIRPIAVGTVWRRLVSKVCATMIGHSLDTYLNDLQFGVGVSGGGEAILHAVNRLIEDRSDDIGLSMLLVDFKNAFNLVDREAMLQEVRIRCPAISRWVEFCYSKPARLYYGEHTLWSHQGVQQGDPLGPLLFALVLHLDDGTIVGDTLVVGKVLELIMEDGPRRGLHLNVDKTEVFWPREDPRSRLVGVFPPSIARPLHGVKLLGGPVSVDFDFNSGLVLKRVSKSIELMDVIAKLNDPQCELLLLRACAGISKLYFAMRTCSPQVFGRAQHSFDTALRSSLERIVTGFGPGFGDWQWRLATLPFSYGGLGVYSAGDVLNYAFLASRLQSASLQTKLLRHSDIVSSGLAFDNALNAFNVKMEIDLLSNPSEIAAPKLMKKLADIYFTSVTQIAESIFSLSTRQMALWRSQMEDHTSDWLRAVPISGLGQTMNSRTYRCVLCYRLGVPLFSVTKPCSACSKVFVGDIYGDHAVSCAGIVGIKHRHNVVRDTLVDICYRSGISSGKEVDIGLGGGSDKSLRPADVLLYSWDVGRDVCVDLTGSSPLTQTGMADFVSGRAVNEAAQRKRVKYEAKCADIGYSFLPFSFSSFGELEKDAVTLLKRIRKFSMT
ncbi:putative reverse transcriptase domain-containing protein [Tanacetum coccineum]